MGSISLSRFHTARVGAEILKLAVGKSSPACADQGVVDQTCLKASLALAVGCWEGYVEAALREFVSKTRVQAHRNSWVLIAQFETIVDKMAAGLNTPNWDNAREILITLTGMDPYASWVWSPKYVTQTDTKRFLDGVMLVRHAFAHGFPVPADVPGLTQPGVLDLGYLEDALKCLCFFAETTDGLLEHELTHRHGCKTGWN